MSSNHYSELHPLISEKDREQSKTNITSFLNERTINLNHILKNNTENISKLVNSIDDMLYKKANSLKEYIDNTTLHTRIKAALIKLKISNTRVSSYSTNNISIDNEAVNETNMLSQLIDDILVGLDTPIKSSTSDVTVNESAATRIEESTFSDSIPLSTCDLAELNHSGADANNTHTSPNVATSINHANTNHHNYDPSLMDTTDCEQSNLDYNNDAIDANKASKLKLTNGKILTVIYTYSIMYTSISHVYTYLYTHIAHT